MFAKNQMIRSRLLRGCVLKHKYLITSPFVRICSLLQNVSKCEQMGNVRYFFSIVHSTFIRTNALLANTEMIQLAPSFLHLLVYFCLRNSWKIPKFCILHICGDFAIFTPHLALPYSVTPTWNSYNWGHCCRNWRLHFIIALIVKLLIPLRSILSSYLKYKIRINLLVLIWDPLQSPLRITSWK